jgi:hypothetical protein
MRSEITAFERDRRIAWAPDIHPKGALRDKVGDRDPCGQQYIWELEPTDDGGTRVRSFGSRLRTVSASSAYALDSGPLPSAVGATSCGAGSPAAANTRGSRQPMSAASPRRSKRSQIHPPAVRASGCCSPERIGVRTPS